MGRRSDREEKKEDSQTGAPVKHTSSKFNHLGTEYIVNLDSMQGSEHQRPTIRMTLGHRGRKKIIRGRKWIILN